MEQLSEHTIITIDAKRMFSFGKRRVVLMFCLTPFRYILVFLIFFNKKLLQKFSVQLPFLTGLTELSESSVRHFIGEKIGEGRFICFEQLRRRLFSGKFYVILKVHHSLVSCDHRLAKLFV